MVAKKVEFTIVICLLFVNLFTCQQTTFADENKPQLQQHKTVENGEIKTQQVMENGEKKTEEFNKVKEEKLVPRPNGVPPFPDDNDKLEIKLSDDGFTNNIRQMYDIADKNDIFVDTRELYSMNNRYIAGNEDDITRVDAILAEKGDVMEYHGHKREDLQTTHRTRVLAYLTKDQVKMRKVFSESPHGYYYNALREKMDKRRK